MGSSPQEFRKESCITQYVRLDAELVSQPFLTFEVGPVFFRKDGPNFDRWFSCRGATRIEIVPGKKIEAGPTSSFLPTSNFQPLDAFRWSYREGHTRSHPEHGS